MRIQHNVMAMNAYRNYNTNTSALSKNLEKLSSGYKINRAGDDAAGLAISEKMRAQITGLNAAQKNVKDGISLVKTAEGAMQEIQDMLNRMDYLATQSANGTYDNDVDRAALQKEVEQLKSEINRIADSANFNGIKLLDGSLDTTPSLSMTDISGAAGATTSGAFAIVGDGQLGNDAQAGIFSYDLSQFNLTVKVDAAGGVTAQSADGGIMTLEEGGTPMYVAGDDGVARLAEDGEEGGDEEGGGGTPPTTTSGTTLDFTFGGQTVSIDLAKLGIDTSKEGVYTLTGADIIGELTTQLQATFGGTAAADPGDKENPPEGNNPVTPGTEEGGDETPPAGPGAEESGEGIENAGEGVPTALIDDGIAVHAGKEGDGGWSVDSKLAGSTLTFSNDGTTLTVTMNSAPSEVWSSEIDMTLRLSDGTSGNGGEQFAPTVIQEPIDSTKNRQYAQATIDLSQMTMKDGATIQLGDTTYTFAIGKDSKFKDAANVIDLTDFTVASFTSTTVVGTAKDKNDADLDVTASEVALTAAANRFSQVAKSNDTFIVGSTTQGVITLTEREGAVDYAKNNLAGADGLGTKGTDDANDERNGVSSKADSDVNDWKGLVKFGNAVASSGNALTLQIGDTSDDYNQLKVKVGDMHTSAMGIADLDISNQEGAASAIQTIRNAINYVSSVRGDLGATQNRLEHTGNNLSVMAENIQDAESTIRDTDVAEEMMSYVKNNILVQSAQAMLAQANQVPQGVLQLLG